MRIKSYLLLVLIGLSFKSIAQPAVGTWNITGPVAFPVNVTGQVNGMGRVSQLKFHPSNPAKLYAVSASGGLYISTDTGNTWNVTSGTEVFPQTSCSSVCIDYTNDNILYLSTGDANYYNNGYGIWKSLDGGASWAQANTGIGNNMAVEMIMDPLNHNTIVAATNNGIWKTTDGAGTWTLTQVGPFKSMKLKPGSSTTLYAATDTLFYVSNNMGTTWTNISSGVSVPVGNKGLRIAVTPADNNLVLLGTTGGYGKILKSTDGGSNFSTIYSSATQCIVCYDSGITSGSQGNYNFDLTINPADANEVLLASHCMWRSTDGGLTWSWRTKWWLQLHTDMHQISFDPYDLNKRFNANDGGVWMSKDPLVTSWAPLCQGLACTEDYHGAQSPQVRQVVSAGTQDNGESYFDGTWKCNRGGDWTSQVKIDYTSLNTVYYNNGKRRNLTPLSGDYTYNPPHVTKPTFNIEFSKAMPTTAFIGTDSLWRSRNVTSSSPSWTFLYRTGAPFKAIAPCLADTNILYMVTNNGKIIRTDNALAATPTFTVMTTPAATNATASIATDGYNANIVYLSCNNKIYESFDKGANWTNITGTLPGVNIIKIITDEYSGIRRLFACQATKVWYKDNLSPWTLVSGLPTIARISDMMIYNDSTAASILRVSSYGRGVWEVNINNNMKPIGDFYSDRQQICVGDTIRFHKSVYGSAPTWTWSFPGGVPATSTADSPLVYYPTAMTSTPTLTLFGAGSAGNDTVIKAGYIVVSGGATSFTNEGFEASVFPPATTWIQQSESGYMWRRTDSAGGYGTSSRSMLFDNYNFDAKGKNDRMLLPGIDLTMADTAYLTFDVAYSYYLGSLDTLSVEVSADCGRTFNALYMKDGSTLATAPYTASFFIPGATQWRTETVYLTPYLGQDIKVAFNNQGHSGQSLYIDNINISVHLAPSSVSSLEGTRPSLVFPNPANELLNIDAATVIGTVVISNVVGVEVYQRTCKSSKCTLDISSFAPGLYFVRLESGETLKFVKQ
jgi:photosystem II stability/assembly factor-like uncharacterized protein